MRRNDAQLDLLPDPPRTRRSAALVAFHNRGGAPTPSEAVRQSERNLSQQGRVLAYLREHQGRRFTPPELAKAVGIARENSVQRSLSDLLRAGLVLKWTGDRREGSWGVPVCTWSAARQDDGTKA